MHRPASCSAYGETKWADGGKEGERDECCELVNKRESEGACERRSLHGTFLRVKSKVNPEEEGPSAAPLVLSLFLLSCITPPMISLTCFHSSIQERCVERHWANSTAVCLGRHTTTICQLNYKIKVALKNCRVLFAKVCGIHIDHDGTNRAIIME